MFGFGVYSDKNCVREIPSGNPLSYNLDMQPEVDNVLPTGYRPIRLSMQIKPNSIADTKFTTQQQDKDGYFIVSFCTRVWTKASEFSPEQAFVRERQILLEVDTRNNASNGIQQLLDPKDRAQKWAVDTFLCDSEMKRVETVVPVTQGQRIRLCLVPTNLSQSDGMYLSAINYFEFQRGTVVQTATKLGDALGDKGDTEVYCPRGSKLCAIDTVLDNQFFHSPGRVEGSGSVFLQFGQWTEMQQRSLLRRNQKIDVKWSSIQIDRALYEMGDSVAEKLVSYTIPVELSDEEFLAEAFLCNHLNEPIDVKEAAVQAGEPIRVCIQPDLRARDAGVFIRRIENFQFTSNFGTSQSAVDSKGLPDQNGNSLVICNPTICSIKTDLVDAFFRKGGTVSMKGEVFLQFGSQELASLGLQTSPNDTDSKDNDPGFAGITMVETHFRVASSLEAQRGRFHSVPGYLKGLYGLIIGLACFIFLCCLCGIVCFVYKQDKATKFVMRDLLDIDVKETDDSVDACMDSKASFYSDLEFDTDASGNSSDEESITENFDEDLEATVYAMLFPKNPNPHDLSKSIKEKHNTPLPTGTPYLTVSRDTRHTNSLPDHRQDHVAISQGVSPSRCPPRNVNPSSSREHGVVQRLLPLNSHEQKRHVLLSNSDCGVLNYGFPSHHTPVRSNSLPAAPHRSLEGPPGHLMHCLSESQHSTTDRGSLPNCSPIPVGNPLATSEHRPTSRSYGLPDRQPFGTQQAHASKTRPYLLNAVHAPSYLSHYRFTNNQNVHDTGPNNTRDVEPINSSHNELPSAVYDNTTMTLHVPQEPSHVLQQPRLVAKGQKSSLGNASSYNRGYHLGGMTQIPRAELVAPALNTISTKETTQKITKQSTKKKKKVNSKRNSGAAKKDKKTLGKAVTDEDTINQVDTSEKQLCSNIAGRKKTADKKKKTKNSKSKNTGKGCKQKGGEEKLPSLLSAKSCGNSESTGTTETATSNNDRDASPLDRDVCFEAEDHPGTKSFLVAVRKTLKALGPSAYSPKVYRHIKRQLPDRRFFVCDDDDKPFDWREATKSELIDLFWKSYEEMKPKLFGMCIEEEKSSDEDSVSSAG
jgi:hypothetical protein